MKLTGSFTTPGDKSISHRIALLSLLAKGTCRVSGYSDGDDCASSLKAIQSLGVEIKRDADALVLAGIEGKTGSKNPFFINCGNSGTTMRILTGILAGMDGEFVLDGDSSLQKRPMDRIAIPLNQMGADISTKNGYPPVRIVGRSLHGIEYTLPVPSAQLKSAILLAGIQAGSLTKVEEPHQSRDHTERLLKLCGADIRRDGVTWIVSKSGIKLPDECSIPGDPSSAAFFICGTSIIQGSDLIANNILLNPTRIHWCGILKRMGASVEINVKSENPEPVGRISGLSSGELKPVEINADEIPLVVDEIPILALVATQCKGTSIFRNISELRIKETDRIAALVSELGKMGAILHTDGDDLIIEGPTRLIPPESQLDSFGDHRIAMTLAIAGIVAGVRFEIKDYDCTGISYPGFTSTLESLISD